MESPVLARRVMSLFWLQRMCAFIVDRWLWLLHGAVAAHTEPSCGGWDAGVLLQSSALPLQMLHWTLHRSAACEMQGPVRGPCHKLQGRSICGTDHQRLLRSAQFLFAAQWSSFPTPVRRSSTWTPWCWCPAPGSQRKRTGWKAIPHKLCLWKAPPQRPRGTRLVRFGLAYFVRSQKLLFLTKSVEFFH